MSDTVNYQQVAWMQILKSKDGKRFYMLGKVTNAGMDNTLAVTPTDGNGETLFYCQKHNVAYGLRGACLDCKMQVIDPGIG